MDLPGSPWQATSIQMVRAANRFHFHAAPWIVNGIAPYTGLHSGDLTPDGLGNAPQRLSLSNWNGFLLVPQQATSFRVKCHLFRGVVNAGGIVDVTWQVKLPGHQNELDVNSFDTLCTLAFSGQPMFPVGGLVEGAGPVVDLPNMPDGPDWAVLYHQIRGTTPLGAAGMMRLLSFDVPDGYTLPADWPQQVQQPVNTVLSLNFVNLTDGSPNAFPVTANGVTLDGAGHAVFGGAGWLTISNPVPITLSGDFTIKGVLRTTAKAMDGNCQRRVLSFGGPSDNAPGIYIDPTSGGLALLQEFVAVLKTGTINVATGADVTFQWNRSDGINTLFINGVQDGLSFADNRAWAIAPGAEIGRLHGNSVGRYAGTMLSLQIVNGQALPI